MLAVKLPQKRAEQLQRIFAEARTEVRLVGPFEV
jgi:hypothetical protein